MTSTLWLTGAVGVGKSVTAWQAFSDAAEGSIAYVDIDQVGMLYPDVEHDEFGFQLKNDAVRELLGNYAAAGVDVVLISGVVDASPSDAGRRLRLPGLRYVLLTANDAILRARILERGWEEADADEVVAEQLALMNLAIAARSISTDGMTVGDVAQQVLDSIRQVADERVSSRTEQMGRTGENLDRQVVVVGARATGCSTIGFGLARASWSAGVRTGFADLDQLSFCRTATRPSLRDLGLGLNNVVALRTVFAAHGAERFVVNGHPRDARQLDVLRHDDISTLVVRLRASPESIKRHIESRLGGDGAARLIGDDLAGATPQHQDEIRVAALRHQALMDEASVGDLVLDVDGVSVDELVASIAAEAWQ